MSHQRKQGKRWGSHAIEITTQESGKAPDHSARGNLPSPVSSNKSLMQECFAREKLRSSSVSRLYLLKICVVIINNPDINLLHLGPQNKNKDMTYSHKLPLLIHFSSFISFVTPRRLLGFVLFCFILLLLRGCQSRGRVILELNKSQF